MSGPEDRWRRGNPKPGDWSKLPEATKRQLLDEGVVFVEEPGFPGDPPRRVEYRTGGNETSQRIRKHINAGERDLTGMAPEVDS